MIDLEKVWLPQMVWYAHFISNRDEVRSTWIEGDRSRSSVTDFDELVVQVFDDLSANEMVGEPLEESSLPKKLVGLVRDFVYKLDALDKLDCASGGLSSKDLMSLTQWEELEESAASLADYPRRTGLPLEPDFSA